MKKPTIVFYPNEAKKSSKNHLIPIYLRVSAHGIKTEARLDVSVYPNDLRYWNRITQRLDLPNNNVNQKLESIQSEFVRISYIFKEKFTQLTAFQIKEHILPEMAITPVELIPAIEYIEKYYKEVVMPSNALSKGTKKNYIKAINHFRTYLEYTKKSKYTLLQINKQIALDFRDYLNKDIPDIKKKGITLVSATSIITKIKAIFNRAFEEEILNRNPFKGVKLSFDSPKKPRLEISEVKILYNLELSYDKKLEIYRDIFLFGIFTGLAYSDISNLTWNNIIKQDDYYLLTKNRDKTMIEIRQILVNQAVLIIEKYRNNVETQAIGRIFPKRHLNNINDYLKVIQAKANINKVLSTHIARHTCSQLLRDIGSINNDVINSMLGWSNRKLGASNNYRITTIDMLKDANSKFQEYLNRYL